MIYNIHENQWDQELLDILNLPNSILPEVVNSSEIVGSTEKSILGTSKLDSTILEIYQKVHNQ